MQKLIKIMTKLIDFRSVASALIVAHKYEEGW